LAFGQFTFRGDREAVDEVYDGQFRLNPHFSAHPEVEFRKSGQARIKPPVRFLHLIRHLPAANASFPSRGSLGCVSFWHYRAVRFFFPLFIIYYLARPGEYMLFRGRRGVFRANAGFVKKKY